MSKRTLTTRIALVRVWDYRSVRCSYGSAPKSVDISRLGVCTDCAVRVRDDPDRVLHAEGFSARGGGCQRLYSAGSEWCLRLRFRFIRPVHGLRSVLFRAALVS